MSTCTHLPGDRVTVHMASNCLIYVPVIHLIYLLPSAVISLWCKSTTSWLHSSLQMPVTKLFLLSKKKQTVRVPYLTIASQERLSQPIHLTVTVMICFHRVWLWERSRSIDLHNLQLCGHWLSTETVALLEPVGTNGYTLKPLVAHQFNCAQSRVPGIDSIYDDMFDICVSYN